MADELRAALEEVELTQAQLDDLDVWLHEHGIELLAAEESPPLAAAGEPATGGGGANPAGKRSRARAAQRARRYRS